MSSEALMATSKTLSFSLAGEGRLLRIPACRSAGICSRFGNIRRAESLDLRRWKRLPFSRSLCSLSRWSTLSKGLCRAQSMASPPDMPFSANVEGIISQACRILRLELFVKPIVHAIRCLDLPPRGLLLSKPSLCKLGGRNCWMTVIARVLGQVLVVVMLLACISLQPFSQVALPAHAAISASNVDVKKQDSEDYYDILFKKFEEKDEEMGRSQESLLQNLKELHMKVKDSKERALATKRALEELHKSESNKPSLSSHEERVRDLLDRTLQDFKMKFEGEIKAESHASPWDLLDMTFQDFKMKFEGEIKAESHASPYEQELRRLFDEKIAVLLSSKSKSAGGWESDVELKRKVRNFIVDTRLEVRKLQAKELTERQETCKKLQAEESLLKDNLESLIKKHFYLWEQVQVSDGDSQLSNERLQELESDIQALWENLLNVKATLCKKQIGDLQEALVKLPSLELRLEEELWKALKEKRSMSSDMEAQQNEAQEKAVKDLKQVLDSVFEHKFLPEALDASPKAKIDEQIVAYLDSLKAKKKPMKELMDTIKRIIHQDIEVEKVNEGRPVKQSSIIVAPGLQRLKSKKNAEFKQFLKENPQLGREYAAQKQVRILTIRDRVLAQSWYNDRCKRWEMSSEGLKYAVDKGLVENAQVRQDKRVMLFHLKGDNRTFYADLLAYDAAYFDYGGFNALHLKMLGSGISAPVVLMPIPLTQQDPINIFLTPFRVLFHVFGKLLKGFVENPLVISFYYFTIHTIEELFGRVVFPVLEKLPRFIRTFIGLQLPDNAPSRSKVPFLMALKKLVQGRLERRLGQGEGNTAWWLTLPLRWFIIWIPYAYVAKLVGRILRQVFGPGDDTNDVEWKQKKGVQLMKKLNADNPKAIEDPVRQAFDKMRRVKDPEISLEEFAGLETVKEEIKEIIQFLRDPEIFKDMGARPPRGVLLAGMPGTGKTSLAVAIAAEAKVPIIELNGLELEGGAWVGQGASNVRELFKMARELAPLVILMDDFDYFAGVRGESGDTRKQDHESLINQLLVELDGFETQEGVVVIATSSRPETIDEALRRPGRMDRTITLPMPNKTEREIILRKSAKECMDDNLIELVDWKEMARKTAGMTPQQLKEVPVGLERMFVSWKYTDDEELFFVYKWIVKLNNITPKWLLNSKWMLHWKSGIRDWLGLRVSREDVEAAVACVDVFNESRPGIEYESPGYIWTREFKFPHAVWAVGRALVGALLPNYDVLENVWLDQGSWEGIGFTRFTKRREGGYEETSTLTRTYYEKKMVHCFGSSIAAELLLPFGRKNDLASHELQEAEKMATRMVVELGWGPDNSQTVYFAPTGKAFLGMGDEVEMELEEKIDMILNAASDKAQEMIMKNRHVLDALLEHLLECDAISKEDMANLMRDNGAIYETEPFVLFPIREVEEDTSSKQSAALLVSNS